LKPIKRGSEISLSLFFTAFWRKVRSFFHVLDNEIFVCYNMMKSYDEEAKRYDAFRECGVGVTAQRMARSIPSEPVERKA
jgi:hypothetical protein